jgi:glucose-6-phosphate isomerase
MQPVEPSGSLGQSWGAHAGDVRAGLDKLAEVRALSRIWAGDGSVFTDDPADRALCEDRLGWLRLPQTMREHLPALGKLAEAAVADDIRDVVLCGMGGSSLAPEVLASVYGQRDGHPRLHVLDTTDPRAIAAVEARTDLEATVFIIASKSGTTIETDSLRRHFTARLAADGLPTWAHLVAITDADSELHRRATSEGWRACFVNPSDVGGRYSALSLFGLVPAALIGVDVGQLLDAGAAEAEACVPGAMSDALELGAAMGALAAAGVDKLTIRASTSLATFGDWVEQLVAESTGKTGPDGPTGILPVVHGPAGDAASDRLVVTVARVGEEIPAPPGDDVAHVRYSVLDAADLGALFWRFEMATALASIVLGVEPFDQKDVAAAKAATNAVLAAGAAPGAADDVSALAEALDATPDGGYVAVLSYLPRGDAEDAAVSELAAALRRRTGRAVTVGVGPRYLHSTGQLHKGGPNTGTFVLLEGPDPTRSEDDLPIPGRDFSFGGLFSAQAEGDAQTLAARGRRLVRLRARDDVKADVAAWAASLGG